MSNGIDHFSVIASTISKGSTADKSSLESKSTSGSVPEVPQNQLEALGSFSMLNKSSSDSTKSDKESLDTKSDNGDSVRDSEGSQPLLSWTKQLQELSQSSPARSKSPLRSRSPRGKNSQEKLAAASPRRSKSPRKFMSPRKNKDSAIVQKGSLDTWLIKSPEKISAQDMDSEDFVPSSQGSVASLVEETQSPTKFSKGKLTKDRVGPNENLHPILETPPRPEAGDGENSNLNSSSSGGERKQ